MTTFERWSLVIAAAGVAVNMVLFIVFALQLIELRHQVKQSKDATQLDHARRRAQATIAFYQSTLEKRESLRGVLPYDGDAAAIAAVTSRVMLEGGELQSIITGYIGLFELLAMGINVGVFDIDVLERMAGTRVRALATNYGPWINARREELGHPRLYSELVELGLRLDARNAVATDLHREYLDHISLES